MTRGDKVHAPLAAPTYLTHVTVPPFRRGRAAIIAIFLHGLAVLLFLALLHHRFRAQEPNDATVALVMEPSPYVGAGPSVVAPVAPPKRRTAPPRQRGRRPEKPAAADAAGASALLATSHGRPDLAMPARSGPPARRPEAVTATSKPAPPTPHAGDNQPAGYGLVVDGKIIPAKPDASANKPPSYPRDAVLHGEQGRVLLSIDVAPSGRPSAVNVIGSSGYVALDNAARGAVMAWQFLPADFQGKSVDLTLLLTVTFVLDGAGTNVR